MTWQLYDTEILGNQSQVLLDDNFVGDVPGDELPNLAWIGIWCRKDTEGHYCHPDELDQMEQIENDLMEFIGPLAKVVVRKESARAMSVEDLQVRIAKSIPAGEKRQAYMAVVSKRAAGDNSSTFSYQKTVSLDQEPIGSSVAKAKAAASAAQSAAPLGRPAPRKAPPTT